MNLQELLSGYFTRPKIILHPDIKEKLLATLRKRYESDITPELWNDLLRSFNEDDHTPQDFLDETNDIAKSVVESYIKENNISTVDNRQVQYWAEELWEESQSFWSEISDVIAQNLNFIGTLIENSKKMIEGSFPAGDMVFGEKATHFLIDLAFQANVYSYTKIAKPYLVDMRRMLNISGQIVEEIFSSKILHKEKTIGEIYRLLESFKRETSPEKAAFYQEFTFGKILLSKQFLENLKTLRRFRDPYSHGASSDTTLETDFSNGIHALLDVLSTIYKLLQANPKKNHLPTKGIP